MLICGGLGGGLGGVAGFKLMYFAWGCFGWIFVSKERYSLKILADCIGDVVFRGFYALIQSIKVYLCDPHKGPNF